VFKKRALRRIFESKRDEIIGGWRKLHNEELDDLNSSRNIITRRMIKSKRMKCAEHEIRMEEKRNAYRVWWESQKERDH
jgi:hypothetical protein